MARGHPKIALGCTIVSGLPRCTTASRLPRFTTASTTDARRKMTTTWSKGDGATTAMGPPEATRCTKAAATIVGRTAAPLLNRLAPEFLAGPSAMLSFQPGFTNRPTS